MFQASKYPSLINCEGLEPLKISVPQLEIHPFFPGCEVPGGPSDDLIQKSEVMPHWPHKLQQAFRGHVLSSASRSSVTRRSLLPTLLSGTMGLVPIVGVCGQNHTYVLVSEVGPRSYLLLMAFMKNLIYHTLFKIPLFSQSTMKRYQYNI